MPPKKTRAAGPRPFRRPARNEASAAAVPGPSAGPTTPEQYAADRKSYSASGLDAGESSVEPSPYPLTHESCRDGPEVAESGGEMLDPGFGDGDRDGGATEVVAEGGGGCGVEGAVSVVGSVGEGEKGEGSSVRKKRIVRRIIKVIKVVKKRVPKKLVVEGQGEGCDGVECKKEDGKCSMEVRVAQNSNDCVAMEADGENGGREVNSIARAGVSARVEGLIIGEFNEGNEKESGEDVDSGIQVNENTNADMPVDRVGVPVRLGKLVPGKNNGGGMKDDAVKEDHDMEDRQRVKLGDVVSKEGVHNDTVAAGSDGVGFSDNVVSSADSREEVDGDDIVSNTGSKDEADKAVGGSIWRGEMEALERKRKRKTEIFVGGLAIDASEDDVRKVFEEVGEIVDVRVVKNSKTKKGKGFAFVRYAMAADAKKALEKYRQVQICGKECGTRPVEGNDTIFLGNINKQWKEVDVTKLLEGIGVCKIDKVTVMAHPNIADRNRGFAFVELESNKDADVAFKKLQKHDELGKLGGIKVAWAKPLNEPDEEEMQKVKSVYAEFIPSSWDEERVMEYFKKFGEIENVTLSRNLPSSRRKDFAFVNFRDREAAITCIQSFKDELAQDGSEVKVKVSLAKPIPKSTSTKKASHAVTKSAARKAPKPSQRVMANQHYNKGSPAAANYLLRHGESTHSRTAEAVQFLREREQTSWMLSQRLASGSPNLDRPYSLSGNKRPLPIRETDPLYAEFRGHGRACIDNAYQLVGERLSAFSHGSRTTSLPQHQPESSARPFAHHYLDPVRSFQRDEAPPYLSSAPPFYRYQLP